MAHTNRRQFIQRGVFAAAALRTNRMQAAADVSQPGPAPEHRLNSLDPAAIRRLRAQISGLIITPDSAEYGPARMIFNRAFDRHRSYSPLARRIYNVYETCFKGSLHATTSEPLRLCVRFSSFLIREHRAI
jgi:hypothetical protein